MAVVLPAGLDIDGVLLDVRLSPDMSFGILVGKARDESLHCSGCVVGKFVPEVVKHFGNRNWRDRWS